MNYKIRCATCRGKLPYDPTKNPEHRAFCSSKCRAYGASRPKMSLEELQRHFAHSERKSNAIDQFSYAGRTQ